jgi:hypothetical protein
MPRLTDHRELKSHLADAMNGGRHWVFVTDHEEGHLLIRALALAWIRGGLAESELHYGQCDFLNRPTGHRTHLSFVTVPKAAVPLTEVNRFLKAPIAAEEGFGDVLHLLTDAGAEAAFAFLAAAQEVN